MNSGGFSSFLAARDRCGMWSETEGGNMLQISATEALEHGGPALPTEPNQHPESANEFSSQLHECEELRFELINKQAL